MELRGLEGFSPAKNMNVSENKRRAVGVVENYYPKQKAAAVKLLEEGIKVGDEILVERRKHHLSEAASQLSLKKRGKRPFEG